MFSKIKDLAEKGPFNVDASLTLVNIVFASTERLAALNLNTARELLEQSSNNLKAMQHAKDVKAFAGLPASQVKPVVDNAISYSRSVYEIAKETRDEVAKVVDAQVADANAKVNGLVDKALKSAPAGSEGAVAAIRSAMATASSAYGDINKAVKQAAEMAEANVIAAGDATLKLAANAGKIAKKAA